MQGNEINCAMSEVTTPNVEGTGSAMYSSSIIASEWWSDTGIQIKGGMRYRFEIDGKVNLYDASIHVTNLDGWPDCWQKFAFAPFFLLKRSTLDPWFALIATIDEQNSFRIARDGQETVAPASGTLICYINDGNAAWFYKNNKGELKLRVTELL